MVPELFSSIICFSCNEIFCLPGGGLVERILRKHVERVHVGVGLSCQIAPALQVVGSFSFF